MDFWQILSSAMIPLLVAAVTGTCGYFKGKLSVALKEREEREKAINRLLDDRAEQDKIIQELVAEVKAIQKRQDKIEDIIRKLSIKIDNLTEGGKALLRDRIIQSCRHFCELEYITSSARQNLYWMHKAYASVNKDIEAKRWYNKIKTLEIKVDDVVPYIKPFILEDNAIIEDD